MSKASRHHAAEELVHRSRAMWLRSLGIVRERGKSPAQLLADQFEANPLMFMEKMAKYLPKDLNINHNNQSLVDLLISLSDLRRSPALPVNTQPTEEPQQLTH